VVVDGRGLVRPGARRCAGGEQELVDTVECRLVWPRLWGAQRDLGVVGVHRDVLELVPGDGTAGLRRLRPAPPRPAAAIRPGLPQCVQQPFRGRGRPGQLGIPVRRAPARQPRVDIRWPRLLSRPCSAPAQERQQVLLVGAQRGSAVASEKAPQRITVIPGSDGRGTSTKSDIVTSRREAQPWRSRRPRLHQSVIHARPR